MRTILLAICVLAACKSVRETECQRILELTGPKRTWSYEKPVPLSSMEWKDPEIRAAIQQLENGTCIELAPDGKSGVLQCPNTLAQLCGEK